MPGALDFAPRRHLFLTLVALYSLSALSLWGCSPNKVPSIQQVTFVENTDDTGGPYVVYADVRPGDGPTQATLFVSPDGPEAFLPALCLAPPTLDLSRTSPDAQPPAERVDAGVVSDGGLDGGAVEDGGLGDGGPEDAGLPDAQVEEPSDGAVESGLPTCYRISMSRQGDRFEGRIQGPPFLPGTRLFYFIEVRDTNGDRARWPSSAPNAPATVLIGPAGRAPDVDAITPQRGPSIGGTRVWVKGSGFSLDTEIRFGATVGSELEIISPHLMSVVTPPGQQGAVDVFVARQGLTTTLPGAFTYEPPPVLLSAVPREGPTLGGTLVMLTGEALGEEGRVLFGGAEASAVRRIDDTRMLAESPPQPAGVYDIEWVAADGQRSRLSGAFTYWPPPEIEALQPETGPDLGGTPMQIIGRDFRAPAVVLLDERPASDVVVSPDGRQLSCITPAGVAGIIDVTVINPDGQFDVAPTSFRYVGPPMIETLDTPVLARCGPTEVVLTGANFEPGAQFLFNGVPAEVIEIDPDGMSALLRVPPGPPGPVRVEVVNPDGRRARVDNLAEYGVRPIITDIDVTTHPIWGGTVTQIEGGDLEAGARVFFDGVAAESVIPVTTGCDALLRVVVPPGEAGPADVLVVNPDGGEAGRAEGIEYIAPALRPDEGLTPGYTNVELTGVDLRAGLDVRIGGQRPRALTQLSEERWLLTTPTGVRGGAEISVFNVDRRGARIAGGFTYRAFDDDGDARFEPEGDCNDVLTADIDADGFTDLVVANGSVGMVGRIEQPPTVHYGRADGRFESVTLAREGNGMNVSLGDVEGDGDLDLFVANLSSASNSFFRNEGGRFQPDNSIPVGGPSYDAALVDIDGDGDVDIFLANTGDPENANVDGPETLLLNNGRGIFDQNISDQVYFSRGDVHDHDVEFGDVDGDGLPDAVLVVDNLSDAFRTAENRLLVSRDVPGNLSFRPSPFNSLLGDWLHAEMADIDSDGDLDVLLPQDYIEGLSLPDQPALGIFLNDGTGQFEPAHERNQGLPLIPAFETVSVDLDDDGDLDILVGGYGLLFQDGQIDAVNSFILLNDGTANFFDGSDALVGQTPVATADFAVLDVDGDGDADLFECAARRRSRIWLRD
ncbi:MAG: IPT/TIG domain-containing protein [Bradymonadia bacterium]